MKAKVRTIKLRKKPPASRLARVVYVVGAGFSAGLGYPLTKSLLTESWSRLEKSYRTRLGKIIAFHHPDFDPLRKTTFPDIEQLLTEIYVNLEMFEASRSVEGGFTKDELLDVREYLLFTIARWFHEIHRTAVKTPWLKGVVDKIRVDNAIVISFNWDLVLEQMLFGDDLGPRSYGLFSGKRKGPELLKPHGSLNWYEAPAIKHVKEDKHITLFSTGEAGQSVDAFLPYREITTTVGRRYTPLIIPPTYFKDFSSPLFGRLWRRCTEALSTAKEIIVLGYSLPPADLQAQFIFRCGFHNQLEGHLLGDGSRSVPTGPARVTVVNPDQEAGRRIEFVVGKRVPYEWIPRRIVDWLDLSE